MAGALLCILLELYFLAPAAMGIWHVGMLYPMVAPDPAVRMAVVPPAL